MESGDLVISLVLEARNTRKSGIDRRRRVATFSNDAQRLFTGAVVGVQIEQVSRVQSIALCVERIAGIFHENNLVRAPERAIVESCVSRVALIKQRKKSGVGTHQLETEDRTEPAVIRTSLGPDIGITGFVEDEFTEVRRWTKLTVLRAFERRGEHCFCQGIRVKWRESVRRRVVNLHPVGLEHKTVGAQIFRVL